jgi:hypothetical protein
METLACRSPSACRACPHSDRAGACALETQLDLALESMEARPVLVVAPLPRVRA